MANKKFFVDVDLQGNTINNLKADTLDITSNLASANTKRIVYWSGQYYYSDGTTWIALGATGTLPAGGATGDILAKASGTDYDVEWISNYTSTVQHEVKAGVAITKGQAVYVSSADGTNMIVSKASNALEATSSKTMGLAASTAALNGIIYVITEGLLTGTGSAHLDTSAATAGDPVWLGTDGNLIFGLTNKPVAPAHLVFIGIVTRSSATVGEIFVKVQNGYELGEIHDVLISSPVSGQILKLDSDSLWKNWTPDYVSGTGTANYLTKFTGTSTIGINSLIYDTGSKIGVGITTPSALFHINNTSASDSFLVEDETNPDATPFVIKSDGRVGLGITDPVAKLDIISPAIVGDSETLLRLRVSDDLNSGFSIYNATGTDGIFIPTLLGENSTDKRPLYFIGKGATDTGAEPLVSFDARIGFNNPVVTRPAFLFTNNGTSLLNILANGDIGIGITNPTAKLHITHTNESDAFKVEDSTNPDASPFVIDKDGNVGIGNPSPGGTAAKVTIQSSDTEGTVRIGGGNGAGNARLFLQSSATDAYIDMYGNSQYLPLRIDAGPLSLNSVAGSGNVGVGTSTPSTKLDVNGDVTISTIANATTDTDKFLVSDSGVIKYRTGSEILSDIAAQGALTVTTTGSSGAATLVGSTLNIPQYFGGSGTTNYISKFTASGTIGNSLIQDNGTGIGINVAPQVGSKVYIGAGNLTGLYSSAATPGKNAVYGSNIGDDAGNRVAAFFEAYPADTAINTNIYIAGRFYADGPFPYAVQLQDSTEGIGKFLKSVTVDGKANWATLTVADTGLTITTTGTSGAATLVGNTLNIPVYNGSLIPTLNGTEIWRGSTFRNNSTTIDTTSGIVLSTTGTNTARSVGTTSYATRGIRLGVTATTASVGRYQGMRGSALLWYVTGGFLYTGEFNISDTAFVTGTHNFWGLASSTSDLLIGGSNNDQPSALTNIIAFANDSGDANLQIMHNDASGVATKIDLGSSFPSNRTVGAAITTIYSCNLYNAPNSSDVIYRIVNKETGAVAQGTLSTNLPASTVGLNFFGARTMGTPLGGVNNSGQFDVYRLGVYSL